MAQLLDHIEYLSKEIGPRPAGTEEEQDAALYIADQFQQEAGFHAEIEEFTSSSNLEGARAIPSVVIVLATVLAMLFNVFTIPALVLTLLAAAVYVLEAFGYNYVSKLLARGASQNVVAKYQPNGDTQGGGKRPRARKVVLIAHYDTGKVKPALIKSVEATGLPVGLACIGAMAATALLLVVRIFIGGIGGPVTVVLNVLAVIALLLVVLPIVKAVLYRVAPYNEGANNNGTGAAALIEVAHRISQGSVSEAELASAAGDVVIHGQEAALESGLIPEGVQITYETGQDGPMEQHGEGAIDEDVLYDERDEMERLLAAKAAIAALTGRPVEQQIYSGESASGRKPDAWEAQAVPQEQLIEEPPFEGGGLKEPDTLGQLSSSVAKQEVPVQSVVGTARLQSGDSAGEVAGFQNAPSWFVAAQKNAKKPSSEPVQAQRSRYNQAIDAAERDMAERARIEQESPAVFEVEDREGSVVAPLPEEGRPAVSEDGFSDMAKNQLEDVSEADVETEPVQPAQEVDLGQTVAWAPISVDKEELLKELEPEVKVDAAPIIVDLPSIDPAVEDGGRDDAPETASPSRSGVFRKMMTDIPSLSGVVRMQQEEVRPAQKRAPRDIPSISSMSIPDVVPVKSGESDVDYDMDISRIEEVGSLGADALPAIQPNQQHQAGQVEMPSSRADGYFRRRRGKDEGLEQTPQEWLDVDEDFDARSVGRARGSWESFREGAEPPASAKESSRSWEGGAFSRVRLGHVSTRSGVEEQTGDSEEIADSIEDRILNEEIGQIIHFRNPSYDTEIWFVAVGSDTELHDGARAFVDAHASELRGAMVVEIESLGAGTLSVASEEGQFRKTNASSRVKRYIRPASEACGIALDSVKLSGADSITTTIQNAGYQAMHLFGAEDGMPALKASADDVFENVDELTLEENVNFLMELLKRS